MPVTVRQAIDDYLVSDKLQGSAKKTLAQHRRTMRLLLEVCGPRMIAPRLTRVEIDRTIAKARDRLRARGPVKEYSLNVYRAALKGFVKFCYTAGYLPGNVTPVAHLEYAPFVRGNGNKRKPLTADQTLHLFQVAGDQHPRDRAACIILAFTGMRESELTELRLRDIRWDTREIVYWRSKTKDWHTAPFTPMLETELRIWLGWYRARHPEMNPEWRVIPARRQGNGPAYLMNPEWPILPTRKARFLDTLKKLLASIGVTDLEGKGAHTLRRTYANLFYELTGDIRAVQEGLGHRRQETTEIYMDMSVQREKNRGALSGWEIRPSEVPGNVIPLRRAG